MVAPAPDLADLRWMSLNDWRMMSSITLLVGVPASHSRLDLPAAPSMVSWMGALPLAAESVLAVLLLATANALPNADDMPESEGRGFSGLPAVAGVEENCPPDMEVTGPAWCGMPPLVSE